MGNRLTVPLPDHLVIQSWDQSQAVLAHTFDPSIQEADTGTSLEFEASLAYIVSSRLVRFT